MGWKWKAAKYTASIGACLALVHGLGISSPYLWIALVGFAADSAMAHMEGREAVLDEIQARREG